MLWDCLQAFAFSEPAVFHNLRNFSKSGMVHFMNEESGFMLREVDFKPVLSVSIPPERRQVFLLPWPGSASAILSATMLPGSAFSPEKDQPTSSSGTQD